MKNACKGVFHLFVLGFIFGFLGLGFWMGAKKKGGYYDPPFKCRVPTLVNKAEPSQVGKGFEDNFERQQIANIFANI
ncbi:hypothetical protein [Psychrobacillus sp. L3]|uniref:hypothetical protein n=1 Tax=Psychrobacillus sp. L3 TaxID=3236891 RepID=UPI0036F30460